MRNTEIRNGQILFTRAGELVRISACHTNAIRFEAFPDCRAFNENFTLLPQAAACEITEAENAVRMRAGDLTLRLEQNGKVTFYKDGVAILEEKPGTFSFGYVYDTNRIYTSKV